MRFYYSTRQASYWIINIPLASINCYENSTLERIRPNIGRIHQPTLDTQENIEVKIWICKQKIIISPAIQHGSVTLSAFNYARKSSNLIGRLSGNNEIANLRYVEVKPNAVGYLEPRRNRILGWFTSLKV